MSIQAYQNNSVSTASPGELTLMLYNGCIKFIKAGKKRWKATRSKQKYKHSKSPEDYPGADGHHRRSV